MTDVTRADVCAAAIADAFKDDGEIFASPMGMLPMLGVRLAKLTSNPDLVISDGESLFLAGTPPLFAKADVVEGWIPFRKVFDVVAYGKRHVMMGATQVDRHGNQNISAIGDVRAAEAPAARLARALRATRSTTARRTGCRSTPPASSSSRSTSSPASARRSPRRPGPAAARFNDIHRIVSNLGVFDVGGPDDTVRLLSVHPGVTVDEVVENTGFELDVARRRADDRASPRWRSCIVIREVLDPKGLRFKEVPGRHAVIEQLLRTPLTELTGVRHPVVQTGMGWVSGPRLVSGTANAGGLGHPGQRHHDVRGAREGDPRGQGPHRPAVRRQPARRRRRRARRGATC